MKSVQIRSFFWSVFSPNVGKYGPEKAPYLDTFHAICTFTELKRETLYDRRFKNFSDMSIKILNKHAPIKKEIQKRQLNALCYKRSFKNNYENIET